MHRVLCSAGKDLKGSVFLEALAAREEPNRNGKMTVSLNQICNAPINILPHYPPPLPELVGSSRGEEGGQRIDIETLVPILTFLDLCNNIIWWPLLCLDVADHYHDEVSLIIHSFIM